MRGLIVWLTGLSGGGKSTIADHLAAELRWLGHTVEVLDGDEVRANLSQGLGYSRHDRDTNIRRIGYVARLLARSGVIAIVAAISPYREARDEVRAQAPRFVEVHVRCALQELARRDVKGLYRRAMAGEIANFTGISDPYEEPLAPDVVVDTDTETEERSVRRVLQALERLGHVQLPVRERLLEGERLAAGVEEARALPCIDVTDRDFADAYLLGTGGLAPTYGFLGEDDYRAVLGAGRLRHGQPFPVPVLLRVDERGAAIARQVGRLALWHRGAPVATVDVEDVFHTDVATEARSVYGTHDAAHPGVRLLLASGRLAVAGDVTLLAAPRSELPEYDLTPLQVSNAIRRLGWRTVVGFQTRNPVHRAHEHLQKIALELVDGLLLHPLVGSTKDDDLPARVRMECYRVLLDGYFPKERVLLATNPSWMRYAGPREAVFHAIIRRNYGCTHFIVGRDHAGVGDYYDTYAAHRIFDEYPPDELGIHVLRLEHAFYCMSCRAMASTRTCPHPEGNRLTLSGTRVRQLLAAGQSLPPEFTRPEVAAVLRRSVELRATALPGRAMGGDRE